MASVRFGGPKSSRTWGLLVSRPLLIALLSAMLVQFGGKALAALPLPIALEASFDESIQAVSGDQTVYAAAGDVSLHASGGAGAQGGFLRFDGRGSTGSAIVFDGRFAAADTGRLSFSVRFSGERDWGDGRRVWLAAIVPRVGERGLVTAETGTSLAIVKDETNHLSLAVHQFEGRRMTADYRDTRGALTKIREPNLWPIRLPTSGLSKNQWVPIELQWDRKEGRVQLRVGDHGAESQLSFLPTTVRSILIGSSPKPRWAANEQFDGDFDELRIHGALPAAPAAAGDSEACSAPSDWREHPHDRLVADAARRHLDCVVAHQRSGGWAYLVALPSGLRFLDQHTVIPYSERAISNSKAANSAWVALILSVGYEVLGDPKYLEAAKRTAEVLVSAQEPHGSFPALFVVDTSGRIVDRHRPDLALIEDHVQTYPVLLLWQIARITGEQRFADAADRGLQFVLSSQNANGSWPHHIELKEGLGKSVSGEIGGGEVGDYATTDPMRLMLLAYRRTGDLRFLGSYRAGADWLRAAFIRGEAMGWAQQYDAENRPVPARHFEPPSVSFTEGASEVPIELDRTSGMTGDARYAAPAQEFAQWLKNHRTPRGWFANYEPGSGRAIRMENGVIATSDPKEAGDFGMQRVLEQLARPFDPLLEKANPDAKQRVRVHHAMEKELVRRLDDASGLWVQKGAYAGGHFAPFTNRVLRLVQGLAARRAAEPSQRNSPAPLSQLTRSEWVDPFSFLMPISQRYEKIDASVWRAAERSGTIERAQRLREETRARSRLRKAPPSE